MPQPRWAGGHPEAALSANNEAFVPFYTHHTDIDVQIEEGIGFLRKRYPRSAQFVAYFQAYTNTYGDPDHLRDLYARVLSHPAISGLVIGTRPDCMDEAMLDFFATLSRTHFVSIEYGVESVYDDVLAQVNRGHDYAAARDAIQRTAGGGFTSPRIFSSGLPDGNGNWIPYGRSTNFPSRP